MGWFIDLWQSRYPRTIDFLKNGLLAEGHKAGVWEAFCDISGLSDQAATAAATFGSESESKPLIWFADLGNRAGEFNVSQPNRIQLSSRIAEEFEKVESGNAAAQCYLAAKVLHELVHWALCASKVVETSEMGVEFETRAFGQPPAPFWLDAADQEGFTLPDQTPLPQDAPALKTNLGDFDDASLTAALPRGIRNRNPGNIRRSGNVWEGLARPDQLLSFQIGERAFCVFSDALYGIRAMAVILNGYQSKIGLRTVDGMINRWAPPNDNNQTEAYVAAVCAGTGLESGAPFSFGDEVYGPAMLAAMIKVENGMQPYSAEQIRRAHAMAVY